MSQNCDRIISNIGMTSGGSHFSGIGTASYPPGIEDGDVLALLVTGGHLFCASSTANIPSPGFTLVGYGYNGCVVTSFMYRVCNGTETGSVAINANEYTSYQMIHVKANGAPYGQYFLFDPLPYTIPDVTITSRPTLVLTFVGGARNVIVSADGKPCLLSTGYNATDSTRLSYVYSYGECFRTLGPTGTRLYHLDGGSLGGSWNFAARLCVPTKVPCLAEIPPLRQRQRNDRGRAYGREISSQQVSIRKGWQGTYA